jgi:uncharacterized protein YodC (DUF2158 family)
MTEQFKSGDVVQLKSGGPLMTVTRPNRETVNGSVSLVWFAGQDFRTAQVDKDTLCRPAPVRKPDAQKISSLAKRLAWSIATIAFPSPLPGFPMIATRPGSAGAFCVRALGDSPSRSGALLSGIRRSPCGSPGHKPSS